jgi:hypothetical protein
VCAERHAPMRSRKTAGITRSLSWLLPTNPQPESPANVRGLVF